MCMNDGTGGRPQGRGLLNLDKRLTKLAASRGQSCWSLRRYRPQHHRQQAWPVLRHPPALFVIAVLA